MWEYQHESPALYTWRAFEFADPQHMLADWLGPGVMRLIGKAEEVIKQFQPNQPHRRDAWVGVVQHLDAAFEAAKRASELP